MPDQKDKWDKFAALAGPTTALLGAVVVATIGYFGQVIVQEMQLAETKRQRLTDLYLYESEKFAEAEETRRIIVSSVIDDAVAFYIEGEKPSGDELTRFAKQLRRLEFIVGNYASEQTLTVVPLMRGLHESIRSAWNDRESPRYPSVVLLSELFKLQRRVVATETARLRPKSTILDIVLPSELVSRPDGREYLWPHDAYPPSLADRQQGIETKVNELSLGGVTRRIELAFSGANLEARSINVRLNIDDSFGSTTPPGASERVVSFSFELDPFNIPTQDFVELSQGHGLAVVLVEMDPDKIWIQVILFPIGEIAGPAFPT